MILQKSTSLALLSASLLTLAGCASAPKAPVYDPAAAPETQAAAFITATSPKNAAKIERIAVTACNVMFAATSSASASTGGGIFDNNRAEASVSVIYTLSGLTDPQLQQLADQVCAASEQQLAASGYQLVPRSELVRNETYNKLQAAGRASPYEYKVGVSEYKVFARTGDSVFDERYIGTASGLGQAFRAAAGSAAWQHETLALSELNASGVNLNILVDFASLESSGQGAALGGLASRNSAEVTSSVQLSISGELVLKPHDRLNCWNRFGKRECEIRANHYARFNNDWPIVLPQSFYSEVADVTTTGDRVASGVTTALSLLGAGSGRNVTRYEVKALPDRYATLSREGSQAFIQMALTQAQAAKK